MTNLYTNELDAFLKIQIEKLSNQMRNSTNKKVTIPPMQKLLMVALKNEWETTLLTSQWVTDEKDSDFRISLARLAGDEAKHFSLIEERLIKLGAVKSLEELNSRTPLYHYLIQQKTTFDRAVTGPYAREALAVARNEVFLELCTKNNDLETIAIYNQIQKDEAHHHQLGKTFLQKNIKTKADFELAKQKITEVLTVVDEIQEMAIMKMGLCHLPGC